MAKGTGHACLLEYLDTNVVGSSVVAVGSRSRRGSRGSSGTSSYRRVGREVEQVEAVKKKPGQSVKLTSIGGVKGGGKEGSTAVGCATQQQSARLGSVVCIGEGTVKLGAYYPPLEGGGRGVVVVVAVRSPYLARCVVVASLIRYDRKLGREDIEANPTSRIRTSSEGQGSIFINFLKIGRGIN